MTRGYDDGGRMTSSVYNNGVSESRTYNVDNTPAAINFSGASIGNLSYTWDDNHNKTSEQITGTMSGYGFTASYDAEDRLTGWDRADAALDQSWNLTPVGDWQSFTENSVVQNRTHGPAHELTAAGGQSVQHDAKGNITLLPSSLRPQPSAFNWDFDNRLKSADVGNNGTIDIEYDFDALGRRVARTESGSTTVFVQNGQQTLADYTSGASPSSPTYTYIWGDYIDELVVRDGTGGRRFYHRNAQYSVIALTNASGTITERYAYDAYGDLTITDASGTVRLTSADDNRYTYTGREWDDALDLYHFRARMYDPKAGRFIGRDPIGFEGSLYNLYEYVLSSPVGYNDAFGESLHCPGDCPQRGEGLLGGTIYGCFCGSGSQGESPIDPMDANCEEHDNCYGEHDCQWFNPQPEGTPCGNCDRDFCRGLRFSSCNRWGAGTPEYERCEAYKRSAYALFDCANRFNMPPM